MIWNTKITSICKIKYPLIMAAFVRHGKIEFAATYSNAGGLGITTAMSYEITDFKNALKKMEELTSISLKLKKP